MNVRVDRDQELGRRDRPEAQIDTVGGANHPSCIEQEALARASSARITYQVPQAPAGRIAAKRIRETSQCIAEVPTAHPVKVGEGIAEGFVPPAQVPGSPQHRREMLSGINPVDEPPKAVAKLYVSQIHDHCCRFGAHSRQHAIDAAPRGHNVSEREARRDETHDLLIARVTVAVYEIDRISASGNFGVASCEQHVQAFADTVHFAGVLAILPSERQ